MKIVSEPTPVTTGPVLSASGPWKGLQSPLTLALVSCAGIGALLFTVTYAIEGFIRPGYDAWQQPIGTLSLGPGGWTQRVNFVVYGVLLLLSAAGWYRLLMPGRDAF